jgi:hypothetical protein
MVMAAVMVVGSCESRSAKQQNHGEQQSLFHAPNHNPVSQNWYLVGVTLLGYAGSTVSPSELRCRPM